MQYIRQKAENESECSHSRHGFTNREIFLLPEQWNKIYISLQSLDYASDNKICYLVHVALVTKRLLTMQDRMTESQVMLGFNATTPLRLILLRHCYSQEHLWQTLDIIRKVKISEKGCLQCQHFVRVRGKLLRFLSLEIHWKVSSVVSL